MTSHQNQQPRIPLLGTDQHVHQRPLEDCPTPKYTQSDDFDAPYFAYGMTPPPQSDLAPVQTTLPKVQVSKADKPRGPWEPPLEIEPLCKCTANHMPRVVGCVGWHLKKATKVPVNHTGSIPFVVALCPTTADNTARLLRIYRELKGNVHASHMQWFNLYTRRVVAATWMLKDEGLELPNELLEEFLRTGELQKAFNRELKERRQRAAQDLNEVLSRLKAGEWIHARKPLAEELACLVDGALDMNLLTAEQRNTVRGSKPQ